MAEKCIQTSAAPTWRPRYSGPGKSGVCRCGHHWSSHHCGIVMNQDYLDQTGEDCVPGGCLEYGFNETEGLGPNGEPHCFNYEDRGADRRYALTVKLSREMDRLQQRWAVLLKRKTRVLSRP